MLKVQLKRSRYSEYFYKYDKSRFQRLFQRLLRVDSGTTLMRPICLSAIERSRLTTSRREDGRRAANESPRRRASVDFMASTIFLALSARRFSRSRAAARCELIYRSRGCEISGASSFIASPPLIPTVPHRDRPAICATCVHGPRLNPRSLNLHTFVRVCVSARSRTDIAAFAINSSDSNGYAKLRHPSSHRRGCNFREPRIARKIPRSTEKMWEIIFVFVHTI